MTDPGPYYRPPGMQYRERPRRWHWLPIIIGAMFAIVAVLLLLIAFYPAWFGLSSGPYPYRWGFGGIFLVFFVLIVLFFIARVVFWSTRASRYGRRSPGSANGNPGMNRPAMVARMRYARGEITREQYDQIMKDLARPPSQQ